MHASAEKLSRQGVYIMDAGKVITVARTSGIVLSIHCVHAIFLGKGIVWKRNISQVYVTICNLLVR